MQAVIGGELLKRISNLDVDAEVENPVVIHTRPELVLVHLFTASWLSAPIAWSCLVVLEVFS